MAALWALKTNTMCTQAVEALLLDVGVRYLVLPSVHNVLHMWTDKFGFELVTPEEHKVRASAGGRPTWVSAPLCDGWA